jgi:predicted DNA-binding protein with PD1-like motif
MKFSEASLDRVFVIRLEDRDRLPQAIESFADEHGILCGICFLVGGVQEGGKIVMGPEMPLQHPVIPILHQLTGIHEVLAVGMLFPGEDGKARLHMHAALGRAGETRTGCIRPGIETWQVGELILLEIKGTAALRKKDRDTGFDLLEP